MKKHNPTTHIGELISKTAFGEMAKGNKMGAVIKHSTIFSFWNNIVGAKFAKFTKPYSIKYNKLFKEDELSNSLNYNESPRKYEQLVLRLYAQNIITESRFKELMGN